MLNTSVSVLAYIDIILSKLKNPDLIGVFLEHKYKYFRQCVFFEKFRTLPF